MSFLRMIQISKWFYFSLDTDFLNLYHSLVQIKLLKKALIDYPSGSALEFYNGLLYLIGDDCHEIVCLDLDFNIIKKITLFDYPDRRIPKRDKPDLECAAIIDDRLIVIGSGSKSPQRDIEFSIDLGSDVVTRKNEPVFYSHFRIQKKIQELNIEGFSQCGEKLLFFNRGNTLDPNQLIVTDPKILEGELIQEIKILTIEFGESGELGEIPLGISGACYDQRHDLLLLTASAENTSNAIDDGEILGSAIAIVREASKKLQGSALIIDQVIFLDTIDPAFFKQKIESVCLVVSGDQKETLILVADNDDGFSVVFKLELDLFAL